MIDAHHHFWTTRRDDYGWLRPDDPVLYRDFGPDALAPLLCAAGVDRSVLVQAAPTLAETQWLLDIARRTEFVAGVVGWAPLDAPSCADALERISADAHLVGVRPMIQDIADDDWMLGPAVGRGLESLAARGLAFDALIHPRHLTRLRELCLRHPGLRVVVDHAAKPEIRHGAFEAWAREIGVIARDTQACCKLSGRATEAAADWQVEELRRYVDRLLETFGPSRLMWGSDWPVVELAGGFARWREASERLLAELDAEDRAEVLGRTASRFYRLRDEADDEGDAA